MKATQQDKLLQLLRQGKVNSFEATYSLRIKQAPTRIKELKEQGYSIVSHEKADRSVDWELVNEPARPRKPIDWKIIDNIAIPIYADSITDSGEAELQPTQSFLF